jgi:hypothetical protein
MSEIRINIIDDSQMISGNLHGSFGDLLIAALTAEPETIVELETALGRFVERESDWSIFRSFRKYENFESYDAGLLVIDLAAKVILADSTYSYYSTDGSVRIKTNEDEDFNLPYKLSDDWKHFGSLPEFEFQQIAQRKKRLENPLFDARQILFGKPLFEFITAECATYKNSTDENLFTDIHARWLMTERADLRGKTPREILLEKLDFIDSDLHSRSLQWTFTSHQPPPLPDESNAYKFAGFGTHETVVYYDLFRHLLKICFENGIPTPEVLEKIAAEWLNNPQAEFSDRTPAKIIEAERRRINLTAAIHECAPDEDCETCQIMAPEFIDTPMFWGLDAGHFEFDRFEFSFCKTREEWEEEQRRDDEATREFNEKHLDSIVEDNSFFDLNDEIV